MAMNLVKKTAEYSIFKRKDGRYAVKDASKNSVNGDEKARILAEEGFITTVLAAAPEEAPVEEAAAEEPPAEEPAVEEHAGEEAAVEAAPVEEAAPEQAPAEEPPADEAPAEEEEEK